MVLDRFWGLYYGVENKSLSFEGIAFTSYFPSLLYPFEDSKCRKGSAPSELTPSIEAKVPPPREEDSQGKEIRISKETRYMDCRVRTSSIKTNLICLKKTQISSPRSLATVGL